MKLIETSEYKNSVKIKEEILDPIYYKQNQNTASRGSSHAESSARRAESSQNLKVHSKPMQLETAQAETSNVEKSLEAEIKNLNVLNQAKNKTSSSTKIDTEELAPNTLASPSGPKKGMIYQQTLRKVFHSFYRY